SHERFFYRLKTYSTNINLHDDINRLKVYYNKFQKDNRFREALEFDGYLKNGEFVFTAPIPRFNLTTTQDEFVALFLFNNEFRRLVRGVYEKYKDAFVINGTIKSATPNIPISRTNVFVDGTAAKEIRCDDKCTFRHVAFRDKYTVKINAECFSEYSAVLKEQSVLIKLKPVPIQIVSDKQTIMVGERSWLKTVLDCKQIAKERFYWTINGKGIANYSDKIEFIGNDVGNYHITATLTDNSGTPLFEGSQNITVIERLTVGINGPSELEQNEEGVFSIYAKTGSLYGQTVKYSYSWLVNNRRYSSNESAIRLRFNTLGNHTIKLDFWQWIPKENRWQKIGEAVHNINVKPVSSSTNQIKNYQP
ncbi:MAG: hypothetical protein SNJ53_05735, partial [Thermodesulfovibrionales bacterium]